MNAKKIRCMIVDDEPIAIRILEKYVASLPLLECVKSCTSALEAMAYLHENTVELIFLDIKMPELTGMEFLKTLIKAPDVIITTAFSQYALEGYEYSVVDYLLKPIPFERFLKAVNKVIDKRKGVDIPPPQEVSEANGLADFIFMKSGVVSHRVHYENILYIEGCGNYVKVYTGQKMVLVQERMSMIEALLPAPLFLRIHKSFIVAVNKIDSIQENRVVIGDKKLPVGNSYKVKVKEVLDQFLLKPQVKKQ